MTGTRRMGAGEAGLSPGRMIEAEFRSLYGRLRSRRPWGPDDRRGALNYLTADRTLAGAGEVRLGRTVSLAAPVEGRVTPDNPEPAHHHMLTPPAGEVGRGLAFGLDRIEMNIHGNADSHLDALSHVLFDGELYNGVPADSVTDSGVAEMSVDVAADGIVGRGVLLDYLALEELVRVCETTAHWTFLCVIAPLRLPTGTGSPINPIAVL